MPPRPRTPVPATALLVLPALVLPLLGLAGPAGATAARVPADTIVRVTGSAADGFTLTHRDGTHRYPPTGSEARAECGEHDRRIVRVRCRVEVRTWYRDLGDLKRSLRWARSRG